MKYINTFKTHASYEEKLNGGVDISLPNVSYCEDVKDIHYTPYNLVRFYVGEITGTTPQTVKIYTDNTNHEDVTVSEGNKWYTYVLPKDKSLCKIESGTYDSVNDEWSNGIVTKAVVKANINYSYDKNNNRCNGIVPWEITEASFKGSNTSNVTSMVNMFRGCSSLNSLDLSGWDTSKVTNMSYMFLLCSNLTSLDVSNFNTSNVTDMSWMFTACIGLTSLDVSSFNTSMVTHMDYMFGRCISLTSLDVSRFNTSNVTNMGSMFAYCSNLTSLNLRNFNTSNVTNMLSMFDGCSGLTSLDLSGWNMSKVIHTTDMFNGCSNLTSIRMKGCNQTTIDKIKALKPSTATIVTE